MLKKNTNKLLSWIYKHRIELIIFFAAFFIRILYIGESTSNPSFFSPIVDSKSYHQLALKFIADKKITDNFFWQPIFYPIFLIVCYMISGNSILFTKIIQIIIGCFTCLLTYKTAKALFGKLEGLCAGLLLSFYGPVIFFESELLASGLAAFFAILFIWLSVRCIRNQKIYHFLLLGLCGGLSIITRPTFLPIIIITYIYIGIVCFNKIKFKVLLNSGGLLISLLIIILPVAFLSLNVTGQFSPIPSNGGINFYIGNNPEYDKTVTIRPDRKWEELISLPEEDGIKGDIWEKQDYYYRKVSSYIKRNPVAYIILQFKKTAQFFSSREIARNIYIYFFSKWSFLLRGLVWKIGQFGFPFGFIFPLCIFGLIVTQKKKEAFFLLLFIIIYSFSIIIVFPSARYRIPIIPVLAILSGVGIISIATAIKKQKWKNIILAVCVIISGATLVSAAGPFAQEKVDYEVEFYEFLSVNVLETIPSSEFAGNKHVESINKAKKYLEKVIELNPAYADAYNNLGYIYDNTGQSREAIRLFTKAISLDNEYDQAYYNLGNNYARKGDYNKAKNLYEKAVTINPEYKSAYYNLGHVNLRLQLYDQAVVSFQKVITFDPEHANAHFYLGEVYDKQGLFENAISEWEYVLKIDPGFNPAIQNIIKIKRMHNLDYSH